MPPGSWHERRVIVAGGTAGFGLVLARHLLDAGARLLVVGRSGDSVRRAIEHCERTLPPGRAAAIRGVAADLDRPGEGGRVVGECLRILGGLDDLVFCVGRSGRARILATSRNDLQAYLDANLLAAIEITQAAADEVVASRGHLVFVGSLAGKIVMPFMGPYCVAKAALAAYVEAVRLEVEPRGARVLLVAPGPIRRLDDDPAAAAAADRYADDAARAGLPPEATVPGGTTRLAPLDPDRLAAEVLAACRRDSKELVVPRKVAIMAGLIEWFPRWGRWLLARATRRRG